MAKLFANSGDPDQMLHSVASDLGLQCLPVTLLRVSRLQWVNLEFELSKELGLEESTQHKWIKYFAVQKFHRVFNISISMSLEN